MRQKVDLHTHTNLSDGFFSPSDLVKNASERGIEVLSITDHDSTNAIKEAGEAAQHYGIELISGVEISTDIKDREVHILGYFINPENKELEHYLHFFRDERYTRAVRIVEKLNALGLPLTIEDVMDVAGTSAVGRPHIAEALVKRGLINNYYEAFNKYIGNGCPAHEKKVHLSPQSAFKIISDAGGLSFIAHPGNMPEHLIMELIEAGVDGIEVIHPSHLPYRTKYYRGIVNEYFLLECGGSDFHGGNRNDIDNLGKYFTTYNVIDAMRTRLLRNSA